MVSLVRPCATRVAPLEACVFKVVLIGMAWLFTNKDSCAVSSRQRTFLENERHVSLENKEKMFSNRMIRTISLCWSPADFYKKMQKKNPPSFPYSTSKRLDLKSLLLPSKYQKCQHLFHFLFQKWSKISKIQQLKLKRST